MEMFRCLGFCTLLVFTLVTDQVWAGGDEEDYSICFQGDCADLTPIACLAPCRFASLEECSCYGDMSCPSDITDECSLCSACEYDSSSTLLDLSSSSACFAGSSKVGVKKSGQVAMQHVGDKQEVLSTDESGNLRYADLYHFMHADEQKVTKFVEINTGDGSLLVSGRHLVFAPKQAIFAEGIKQGSDIQLLAEGGFENAVVKSVAEKTEMGIYAPLTSTGRIVVDSILASCYASTPDHDLAHWTMTPVRVLASVGADAAAEAEMHWYSKVLYNMVQQMGGKL